MLSNILMPSSLPYHAMLEMLKKKQKTITPLKRRESYLKHSFFVSRLSLSKTIPRSVHPHRLASLPSHRLSIDGVSYTLIHVDKSSSSTQPTSAIEECTQQSITTLKDTDGNKHLWDIGSNSLKSVKYFETCFGSIHKILGKHL